MSNRYIDKCVEFVREATGEVVGYVKKFGVVDYFARWALDDSGNPNGLTLPGGDAIRVPYILYQSAQPAILPSSGSSNATGLITLTTALPYALASGMPCSLYLPIGVVTAGSQGTGAGMYQATGKGTNNTLQISGTGIVTANGAYTQTTAEVTLATVTIPGGSMGATGSLRIQYENSMKSSSNAKTHKIYLNDTNLVTKVRTTQTHESVTDRIKNCGVQTVQDYTFSSESASGSSLVYMRKEENLAVDALLTFTGQLAVDTDYLMLEHVCIEVLPGA